MPHCPVPLCNEPLGVADVQDLPTNLAAQNMVKLLKREDDVARAGIDGVNHSPVVEAAKPCEECIRGEPATYVCSACHIYMCVHCVQQHRVGVRTKTHDVYPISGSPARQESVREEPSVFLGMRHNPWRCDKHPERDVSIYCSTCRRVMCADCVLCPPHRTHEYDEARTVVQQYYGKTDTLVKEVADVHCRIREAVNNVKGLMESLDDNKQEVKRRVMERYNSMVRTLEQEKEKLLKMADDVFASKKANHDSQLVELDNIAKKLDYSLSYVSRVRSEDNCIPVEFMVLWDSVSQRLKQLHTTYVHHDCQPWESDVIEFIPCDIDLTGAIGAVQGDPCSHRCTATNVKATHFIQGKEVQLSFECRDIEGNPLKTLVNPPNLTVRILQHDGRVLGTMVANFVDKSYQVRMTPTVHGEYLLEVKLLGTDIHDSPFDITVSPPIIQPAAVVPVRVLHCENGHPERRLLQGPFGISRREHLIAVSDQTSMSVLIYEGDLEHFKCSVDRSDQFSSIRGVAIDSKDRLLLVEKESHHVAILNLQNSGLQHIGGRGNGDGQFEMPSCVAVNRDGIIFITDSINQRVQYFDPDYTYMGQVGRWGQGTDEFHDPYGIAVDGKDQLYVTSRRSNKVHIFAKGIQPTQLNPLGYSAVRVFSDRGSPQQKLQSPVGIAVDHQYGYVYVTEDGGENQFRLSVFNSEGEFLASYEGAGQAVRFSHPMGVCVLENHNVVVTDCGNQQLVELKLLAE